MQIDRLVVSRLADQRDHALRLAERIGADQMRALGKQRDRMQKLADLAVGIAVPEHRKTEGRLGDEHVARHQLERRAGRIGDILVIAGGDNTQSVCFHRHLRRAKHMPGGMEGHRHAVEVDLFAIADRLGGAGKARAVAQPHDVQRLLRRQHRAMAGARMVGMAMRDHGLVHRPGRVDVEARRSCSRRRTGSEAGDLRHALPSRYGPACDFARLAGLCGG